MRVPRLSSATTLPPSLNACAEGRPPDGIVREQTVLSVLAVCAVCRYKKYSALDTLLGEVADEQEEEETGHV